jgi:hypothetical protein
VGTLTTTTPDVTIPTDTTTWPAGIPAGSTGTAAGSAFVVDVGTAVPCGTLMQFNLALTEAGCTVNSSIAIRVGAAQPPVTVASENWDALTPPALGTWASAVVGSPVGTTPPAWTSAAGRTHPSGTAFSAPNDARFNSYDTSSGNQARLYQTAPMNFSAYGDGTLSFYMYHDTGFSTYTSEGIQPQYSTDGTTWTSFGAFIPRYAATAAWTQHVVTLPSAVAYQPAVYMAFLATSQYGNDIYLDDIAVAGTAFLCDPCSACTIESCNASAPYIGFAGFAVDFLGEVTYAGCAGTPTWYWDFGDGAGTSTDQNPSYTYAAPGLYIYTMTVTVDGITCESQGYIQICSLTCIATAEPASGYAPLTVNFAADAVISDCEMPNKQEATYLWDFGDGTTSTDQYASHTYTAPGTYTWTCTITVDGTVCVQTGVINVGAFDMHFWDDYGFTWLCVDSSNGFWAMAVFKGPYVGLYSGRGRISYGPETFRITPKTYPGIKLLYKYNLNVAHAELWMDEFTPGPLLHDFNTLDNPPDCPPLGPEPGKR